MRGWKPWTVQPPAGTPIDWDSPYSPGLVDVIDFHGFPKSLLLGTPGVAFGTSQVYGAPTARGVGLDTLASFGGVYFSRADGLYAPANQTHVAVARFSAFSDIYAGLFCSANQSGSNSSFVFQYKGGTSYYLGSNLAAFSIPEVPKTFIGGVVVTAAAANSGGTNVFIDGSEVLATETVGATAYSHSKLVIFGERTSSAGYSCEGLYLLHLFYDQALAPAAAAALSLNPWQVFYKRRRAYSIPTSSGAAGTAAITEASDTVSATGNIAIPGTASITEASDTVAATGALAIAGTAAITEGSDTVSATGVGGEVGTAAITESSDTVSATGALSVTGTAAIAESDDTVSATGALSVTGSAAITEQPDIVAATGGIALSGAAAIFEAGDIVVATGALGLAGTAAITEAPDSVAATGGLPPQVTQGSPQWTISRSYTRNFTVRRSVPRSFTLSRSYTRNFTVTPMAVRFPIKGTSEKVPLTFDFTQDLPSGVTLTGTPVLGVSVSNGTDSNPTGILNGAAGFNSGSTQVIQPVQGGVNGVDYAVTCTCPTTQSNLTLSLVGLLSVRRDLN